ncbi:hypothetical protein LOZ12_002204 [Ophidiomyces ophidiicola]|uniref:Uncharacterized protein n=1 Tax=Ophidiomyces ophidiicola TaxID=1387563 RepID=A0ACB8V115_9EURO|nr:hypothetical protein LOZ64_002096 [Ophidiomyces ophidiicola]KAI1950094.1 hypothetical protein LOZ62_002077 [Ophidiomyces ophidiicola]KAI1959491.1 hypothetical protein LOZ59_003094 [Ophidiomyces ophidiicola]KAI2032228.1 hypothetical protein LOZ45_001099 [Ophidiomyces ophidiicola]KAI2040182.1 hypothetical protein LOZ47_001615 [Ophidiomyces ophidiicola]
MTEGSRAPSLPPGVAAPLTANNRDDRSGVIVVVSAVSLSVALVFLGIRVYIQKVRRTIKLDDILLLCATLIFCIQSSFVFSQVHNGWGKRERLLQAQRRDTMLKDAYVSDLLYISTLYVSKCSGSFFYLRISPGRTLSRAVWCVVLLTTLWLIASVLLVGLRCNISVPWTDVTAECSSLFPRWAVICVFDAIIEVAIAGISIILVRDIQIAYRRKVQIILALSSRVFVIIPATLRLYYLHQQLLSVDPTYDCTYATLCTQIQLVYILLASTVPCLKPFLAAYEGSDAKLTFRGHSGTPRDSKLSSRDEEKDGVGRIDDDSEDRGRQSIRLPRRIARQHRRKNSGQLLIPVHPSKPEAATQPCTISTGKNPQVCCDTSRASTSPMRP